MLPRRTSIETPRPSHTYCCVLQHTFSSVPKEGGADAPQARARGPRAAERTLFRFAFPTRMKSACARPPPSTKCPSDGGPTTAVYVVPPARSAKPRRRPGSAMSISSAAT